jgi:RNA polymerase sigma-70 factor (ECF subfamily)
VRDVTLGDEESLRSAKPAPTANPDHEEGRRLMELARRLPDGYREPLLLKAVHGLSYREIGRILGLPETTIETRIARGRRQLRELALADSQGPLARVGAIDDP